MSYFRLSYEGYLEDNFLDRDSAIESFLDILNSADVDDLNVEEWNEETQEWEIQ